MRARPKIGLSLLPSDDLRVAQLPLFAAGAVEALEWTIDAEFDVELPTWVTPLLDHYAEADVLYAHGVHYSPLSALLEARQVAWLEQAGDVLGRRRYQHVSEHFGFMTVPGMKRGAPLPLPFVPEAVTVGRDRLSRLQAAARGLPVGLENLALAMSRDDVCAHGEFMEKLLEPCGGFVLLDLHNLYCQAVNFDVDADKLCLAMPLQRVRELHIAGGSWSSVPGVAMPSRFRRDTHDGAVPEDVFALLSFALAHCPELEVVFLERLADTLTTRAEVEQYQRDYQRLSDIVREATRGE